MLRILMPGLVAALLFGCSSSSEGRKSSSDATTDPPANAACTNGEKDTGETDIDCGGATCQPCALEQTCGAHSDCASGFCGPGYVCWPGACNNATEDGDETATDCGGPDCPSCTGDDCTSNEQCATGYCDAGVCAQSSCTDGIKNGLETGVDCAGDCPLCEDGNTCISNVHCVNGFCNLQGLCASATCDDGEQNGDETDVDCGGSCAPCDDGQQCDEGTDCQSTKCVSGLCAELSSACSDGSLSEAETDIDCGGQCTPCGFGKACETGADCVSGTCEANLCTEPSTCNDAELTAGESDIDCGGPICAGCGVGKACKSHDDCLSLACFLGVCEPPSCTDEIRNGDETDVDCGGACPACVDGQSCQNNVDCTSGVCDQALCVSCSDQLQNADETDVDCGGGCGPCATGQMCLTETDCVSTRCDGGICVDCADGQLNGDETDVDCGGSCAPCSVGQTCTTTTDCAEGICEDETCCLANACGTCGDLPTEICNGVDDDCDGATDEDLGQQLCDTQLGVCQDVMVSCQGAQGWSCGAAQLGAGSGYEQDETLCDGLDNDCDGETDEAPDCEKCNGEFVYFESSQSILRRSDRWVAGADGEVYAALRIQGFDVATSESTYADLVVSTLGSSQILEDVDVAQEVTIYAPTAVELDGKVYVGLQLDGTGVIEVRRVDSGLDQLVYSSAVAGHDVSGDTHNVILGAGNGILLLSYLDADEDRMRLQITPSTGATTVPEFDVYSGTLMDYRFMDPAGTLYSVGRSFSGIALSGPQGFDDYDSDIVQEIDAAFSPDGTIHVVMEVFEDSPTSFEIIPKIQYLTYTSQGWSTPETIATFPSSFDYPPTGVGIDLGPSGDPYVVYGPDSADLVVARKTGNGWTTLLETSVAFDPDSATRAYGPRIKVFGDGVIGLGMEVDALFYSPMVAFTTFCEGL